MKKQISILTAVLLAGMLLAACGGSQGADQESTAQQAGSAVTETKQESSKEAEPQEETAAQEPAEETKQESAAVETPEPAAEETEETEEPAGETVHPYAFLGLQDMPRCNYLDLFCSYHYIRTYDFYSSGFVTEKTEAVDGVNSVTVDENSYDYSVDGHVLSISNMAKIYSEYEISESMLELAKENLAQAMKTGERLAAREFQGTGKEAVPLYSEEGDATEYEYYEYLTDSSTDDYVLRSTERFYLKDGDVFAIYSKSEMGTVEAEKTEVIRSISGDIPEGTFDMPDLTGYEKIE